MALKPLTNAGWGFETNCFVCEPANGKGLRIPFFYDDEERTVVANVALDDSFSGTPEHIHGGVTVAILDEAMAWAGIAEAEVFAVTRTIEARFLRPVRTGQACRVEARVTERVNDTLLKTSAVLRNAEGEPCARAEAEFAVRSRLKPFWST